ncbi:Hypothetical_protein [Hexamita inflata]|uniref:Hypothetical_protein n=1 Tax=Hexamita inflata TaxID=28002 RepID=A0AA86PEU8_9EUKA|nr:Hypothetical protein HINF_LOCUS22117 [Hexamita inflata]CAI9937937.1 Hypothetical protein HINF_LOCUS25582 [Hexamita inflata]
MDVTFIYTQTNPKFQVEVYKIPSGCFYASLFVLNINGHKVSYIRSDQKSQVRVLSLYIKPSKVFRFELNITPQDLAYELGTLSSVYDDYHQTTNFKQTNLSFVTDFLAQLNIQHKHITKQDSAFGRMSAPFKSHTQCSDQPGLIPLKDGNFCLNEEIDSSSDSMGDILSRPLIRVQNLKRKTVSKFNGAGQFTTDQDD